MAEGLPARFDRATLDRILQRAAELQTGEHEVGGELSSDEVLALGKEVGIPERHLRQAMLEVQSQPAAPAAQGVLDQVVGPARVTAQRVIAMEVGAIERALIAHFDEEAFRVQRQLPGRITWEPGSGWQAFVRRSMTSGRPLMLQKASVIGATVTTLEPGFSHVALSAELRQVRAGYVGGGAAVGSALVAGSAVLLALGAFMPIALAPLPAAAGFAWGISRQFRPIVERTQLGLEVALDHLERGSPKASHQLPPRTTGLIGQIAGELRRALEPPPKPSSR
jgi:hypothetical protein